MSGNSISPNYCPLCLSAGAAAVVGGPTCSHGDATGAEWFPDWWMTASEDRRVAWLKERNG